VVKTVRRRRLVRVQPRVGFGTLAAVQPGLVACGWQLKTACVERLTLSLRQHVAALGRRTSPLCQGEAGWRQQLPLCQVSDNCVRPHARRRLPWAASLATNGTGSAKVWRRCMPAMAAGLTDHGWPLKEGLLYRGPPWPQPQRVSNMAPVADRDVEGRGVLRCRPRGGNEELQTGLPC